MSHIWHDWSRFVTHMMCACLKCPVQSRWDEVKSVRCLESCRQIKTDEDGATQSPAVRHHVCRTENTGGAFRVCSVFQAGFCVASAYLCVFADVWTDSRYYWNLLIHVWPWGKALTSLWIRITAPTLSTLILFVLVFPFSSKNPNFVLQMLFKSPLWCFSPFIHPALIYKSVTRLFSSVSSCYF